MSVNARLGAAGYARQGMDWLGQARSGLAVLGRQGKVGPGADRFGIAGLVRLCLADLGIVRPGRHG